MMYYFHYAILKRNDDYLAVLTNQNTEVELSHYVAQGYILFMYIQAFNANDAIEAAKQNANSEIGKLRSLVASMEQENQRLLNENHALRLSTPFNTPVQPNNINPLDVFGFSEKPDKETIKKRYRELSASFHPDKNGSVFIMQMINEAYGQLKK